MSIINKIADIYVSDFNSLLYLINTTTQSNAAFINLISNINLQALISTNTDTPIWSQGVGYNFDFKLAYKFLRRSEARLRYGNATVGAWRGERVPGTYCDRILNDCDLKACRIQSPNFPGVYPRNATCTYRIEHTKVGYQNEINLFGLMYSCVTSTRKQ